MASWRREEVPRAELEILGAGLSSCVGRWLAERWPYKARARPPTWFADANHSLCSPLLVMSQNLSAHASLALNHPGVQGPIIAVSERDPGKGVRWLRSPEAKESRLRILGPVAQVAAARWLLGRSPEPGLGPQEVQPMVPSAIVYDPSLDESDLAAHLVAWTWMELTARPSPMVCDILGFAHGPLQAVAHKGREAPIWLFAKEDRRPLIEPLERSARSVGASVCLLRGERFEDWWQTGWRAMVRHIRPPESAGADDALYGIARPVLGLPL